jgi:hypothetical protein
MPVEALHHAAVKGGICKDATAILFDGDLKDANCRRLDLQVRNFCSMDKQHYMTSGSNRVMVPHVLFKDGVTNLAKLPSAHVIGILLTIVIVFPTDEGKALLQKAFAPDNQACGTKRLNNMCTCGTFSGCYWRIGAGLKRNTTGNAGTGRRRRKPNGQFKKCCQN